MRRRSFFTAMLVAGALPTIASIGRAASAGISPKLVNLIAEYQSLTAEVDAIDAPGFAWDTAADARMRAAEALLDYQPATLPELAAKMEALLSFIAEDSELVSLNVLIQDAHALAEVVR